MSFSTNSSIRGKFNDYIVEYTPYLKVKDMRGKMVIFRRDRIDFAYIAKAGNFGTWRSDSELWTEESLVSVSNAKDPTVRGTMAVTDVSSPENDDQLQTELNSIAAINKFAREQVRPNEAKTANSSYKPTWVMCFTSGALYNENRTGYAQNASHTNPHLTNLIKQSAADGKAGPTGIVLSDWVYVTEDSGYKTDGETADTQIVPTIALNNFDYISEFILDDELFSGNLETAETFWDLNTQYIFPQQGHRQIPERRCQLGARMLCSAMCLSASLRVSTTPRACTVCLPPSSNLKKRWVISVRMPM